MKKNLKYMGTAVSDIGIIKKTNQDSLCLKIADTKEKGQVVMAVICDGMGGLEKGEVASAEVVRAFSKWFETKLPERLYDYSWNSLINEWKNMIKNLNQKIMDYGKKEQVNLGTTVTAMLIIEGQYMIVHVGDTRIYEIYESLEQLTEDQTFIAREMKLGNMTAKQAAVDSRRNMLLQCVGASKTVIPQVIKGEIKEEAVYLLCSDGFRHVVTEEELVKQFLSSELTTTEIMSQRSREMIEVIKQRKERDNISVLLLKSVK